MPSPPRILSIAFQHASEGLDQSLIDDVGIANSIEYICRNVQNRAGTRLLMASLLAKIHRPEVDICKPYTEIGDDDTYSGRTYDESYVSAFINQHDLPCNSTTAFLTPAFRNRNIVLTPDVNLVGRPPKLYQTVLQLLDHVYMGRVSPDDLLAETVRHLLIVRNERQQQITSLRADLKTSEESVPLSSEAIVSLIQQHLASPRSSRLPVLVVAAAYQCASDHLKERVLPLESHTSADEQTGAIGDVQITLIGDDAVATAYEMKTRLVTQEDIDRALQKLGTSGLRIDNYIFITTDEIDQRVQEYAKSIYDETGGIEVVILDCIGFLRHFLHLFHRIRTNYLEAYQNLVLDEPHSAVSQSLKVAFLALRRAAESGE